MQKQHNNRNCKKLCNKKICNSKYFTKSLAFTVIVTTVIAFLLALFICNAYAYTYTKRKTRIYSDNINPSKNSSSKSAYIQNYESILNPKVLCLALRATLKAKKKGYGNKKYLTIVDYSLPSTSKRLWVINLKTNKIIYKTYVAHGKNSGGNYADYFSNTPRSYKSSLGLYITGKLRPGKYGKSLNVHGIEKYNSNAYRRKIVFHPAKYVGANYIKKYGRLGRSHGCFALSKKVAYPIMKSIANGSYVYSYHPKLLKNIKK